MQTNNSLSDADWNRIAACVAEADGKSAEHYAEYLSHARMTLAAVDAIFEIMSERLEAKKMNPTV